MGRKKKESVEPAATDTEMAVPTWDNPPIHEGDEVPGTPFPLVVTEDTTDEEIVAAVDAIFSEPEAPAALEPVEMLQQVIEQIAQPVDEALAAAVEEAIRPRNGDKIAFIDATGAVHTSYLINVRERQPGILYGEFLITGGRTQGADYDPTGVTPGTWHLI